MRKLLALLLLLSTGFSVWYTRDISVTFPEPFGNVPVIFHINIPAGRETNCSNVVLFDGEIQIPANVLSSRYSDGYCTDVWLLTFLNADEINKTFELTVYYGDHGITPKPLNNYTIPIFSREQEINVGKPCSYPDVWTATFYDVDEDGYMDMFFKIGGYDCKKIYRYEYPSTKIFETNLPYGYCYLGIAYIEDYDNDGTLEALWFAHCTNGGRVPYHGTLIITDARDITKREKIVDFYSITGHVLVTPPARVDCDNDGKEEFLMGMGETEIGLVCYSPDDDSLKEYKIATVSSKSVPRYYMVIKNHLWLNQGEKYLVGYVDNEKNLHIQLYDKDFNLLYEDVQQVPIPNGCTDVRRIFTGLYCLEGVENGNDICYIGFNYRCGGQWTARMDIYKVTEHGIEYVKTFYPITGNKQYLILQDFPWEGTYSLYLLSHGSQWGPGEAMIVTPSLDVIAELDIPDGAYYNRNLNIQIADWDSDGILEFTVGWYNQRSARFYFYELPTYDYQIGPEEVHGITPPPGAPTKLDVRTLALVLIGIGAVLLLMKKEE